jgi:hypothetical protein
MQILEGLRDDFEIACATDGTDEKQRAFFKRLGEFCTYIGRNSEQIPNYGERHRCGEPISTATSEATVNRVISRRMVKKQQMRWSPRGAHLLLKVRTRVLNDDLAADFARWYPGLTSSAQQMDAAAAVSSVSGTPARRERGTAGCVNMIHLRVLQPGRHPRRRPSSRAIPRPPVRAPRWGGVDPQSARSNPPGVASNPPAGDVTERW